MAWWVVWQLLIASTPESHPTITEAERAYLQATVKEDADVVTDKVEVTKSPSPPWLNFFTTPCAWALYLNHFAAGWGAYTLMTYLPKYMKEVLDFDMQKAGAIAVLPYILQWLAFFASGVVADHLIATKLSVRSTRLLLEFLGFGIAGILIVAAGYTTSRVAAVTTVSGASWFGLPSCHESPLTSFPASRIIRLAISSKYCFQRSRRRVLQL